MLKPFKSSVTLDTVISRHGTPVTAHVTSPTSWLSSVMAIVVAMVPLICAAWTAPVDIRAVAQRSAATQTQLLRIITVISLSSWIFSVRHSKGRKIFQTLAHKLRSNHTFVYWEHGVKNLCGGFLVTAQVTEPNTPHAVGYRAAALLKARSVIDLIFSKAWF
jgi:hypothetical protein